ncbi:hypothetical protein diail_4012, partial [Diaporthe ilicicola]
LHLRSISLSTWKALLELGRAGHLETRRTSALHRFYQHIEKPTADLSVYLRPLQSHDFAFISHLRLAGSCLVKAEELLYLPQWSTNLGLLEVMEPSDENSPFPRLSDRLFKAWSLGNDPFPKLKGIRLRTRRSVTEQSLQYITQLPALTMLEVTAGKVDWEHPGSLARDLGWIYCNRAKALTQDDDGDDEDDGDPGTQHQTSLESHRCWLELCQAVWMLDIGPPPIIDFRNHGTLVSHGFDIYNLLEMPALKMLQQSLLRGAPPSSSALASLTMGSDRSFISNPRSKHMFFWRYWQDGVRYPKPSKGKAKEASRKPPTTGRPDSAASGTIRSRKKRETGSLGEALSLLEGQ